MFSSTENVVAKQKGNNSINAETPVENLEASKEAVLKECEEVFLTVAFKMAFLEMGLDLNSDQVVNMLELLKKSDPKQYDDVSESAKMVCKQLSEGIKSEISTKKTNND